MKSRVSGCRRAAGLLVSALLSMTATTEAQIPKAAESPYAAPPDQALVVFSRPRRRQASNVTYRIVNHAGRCLAVLEDGWQMGATMWPGRHMVMVVTGTAPPTIQLMELQLSSGKTYVVNLRSRVHMKSPVRIRIVRRADQPLEAFPPAVVKRAPVDPDLRRCTEWVSWKRSKIETRAEQVKHKWDEAGDEYREALTLRRRDGWTATEVPAP